MLKTSSRRSPCPVCGRNTDGDCRFDEDLILCHQGTRFGPPQNLRAGDVVQINGAPWALIRTDAGFDGAAHEFRPDRGHIQKPSPPVRRVQQLAMRRRLLRFIADYREAMRCPEFELLTTREADHYLALIIRTAEQGEQLKPMLASTASQESTWRKYVIAIASKCKTLRHQHRDAVWFFGIPNQTDIASVEHEHD